MKLKTTKNKTYLFTYLDNNGNELKRSSFEAVNIMEAFEIKDKLLAECMLNDCVKIKVTRICK